LFIKQIKNNQPITITNPDMTRFMMSLPQAVELVLFAFNNAQQGDIFVQKAPAATIGLLAETLREIFNGINEIKIIGTRHGEKLFETLLAKEEAVKAVDMGNYYRVPADTRDLNYHLYFDKGDKKVDQFNEYNSHNTHRLNKEELKDLLLNLDYVKKALNNEEDEAYNDVFVQFKGFIGKIYMP
jgi:UDP-glucose 4-epimerase